MEFFNPYPKPDRTILSPAKRANLKKKLYYGRANQCCETCGKPVKLLINGMFISLLCAHLSHNRHGSNKEDTEEGCKIECPSCHIGKKHTKGIKSTNQTIVATSARNDDGTMYHQQK